MEISMYDFLDVLRQLFENFNCRAHLRHTCRRLRIVYLWKDPPTDEPIPPAPADETDIYPDLSDSDYQSDDDLPVVKLERS